MTGGEWGGLVRCLSESARFTQRPLTLTIGTGVVPYVADVAILQSVTPPFVVAWPEFRVGPSGSSTTPTSGVNVWRPTHGMQRASTHSRSRTVPVIGPVTSRCPAIV